VDRLSDPVGDREVVGQDGEADGPADLVRAGHGRGRGRRAAGDPDRAVRGPFLAERPWAAGRAIRPVRPDPGDLRAGRLAFYVLSDRTWKAAAAPPRTPEPPPELAGRDTGAGFFDRLPPRLGRDLLCLQMEDHYVRAHTARGSDLVLIPLKDAIAELGAIEGPQVHRSWWVARAAVVEPVVSRRNLSLRLSNGLAVPVSRASVVRLRAAGRLNPV
jgi:hypothetical protein